MNSQVLIDRVFLQDLLFLIKQPRTKIDARAVLVFGIERALAAPAPIPGAGEGVELLRQLSLAPQQGEVFSRERLHAISVVGYDRAAFVSALQASSGVPEGFRLMPIIPTGEMITAAQNALAGDGLSTSAWLNESVYRAMLAVAPATNKVTP